MPPKQTPSKSKATLFSYFTKSPAASKGDCTTETRCVVTEAITKHGERKDFPRFGKSKAEIHNWSQALVDH